MASDPSGTTRSPGASASGDPSALFDYAALYDAAPAMIAIHEGPEHRYIYSNPAHDRAVGGRPLIGSPIRDAMAELKGQGVFERFDKVFRTGEPDEQSAFRAVLDSPGRGRTSRWYRQTLQPRRGPEGEVLGVMSFAYDVTEEVAAKELAQRRTAELEFALDAGGGVGVWDWNIVNDTVDVDARLAALFGISAGEGRTNLPLSSFLEGIVTADRERVANAIAEAVRTGDEYLQEYRVRTADGEERWVTARGRCVFDAGGAAVRFPGVVVNVTEQVEARRRLERANVLLRAVLDNSASYVFAKDLEGRYILANSFYLDAFGETEDSLYGRSDRDRFGEDEVYSVNDRRVAETGEAMEFEEEAVASDGTTIHAISVKFPLRDANGEIFGTGSISTDITARKRAETALEQSESRRQRAVAAGRVGTFEYLPQEERVLWDPMTYDLFGFTKQEPITLERVAEIMHPDDRSKWEREVVTALDPHGDGSHQAEFRIVRPTDGSLRWIEAKGVTSFDGGQPQVMLGTVRDITELKAHEDELRLLNRELNHRVKNLFAVTQGMIRMSVRQAPEAKAFAAGLSARLDALAAAHLTGLDSESADPVVLETMLTAILRPFLEEHGERMRLEGAAVLIPRRLVTPLSMTMYELATNAFKHGALAREDGTLDIRWRLRGGGEEAAPRQLEIWWREDCREPAEHRRSAARGGFGERLVAASVLQMNAQFKTEWGGTGLDATLVVPLEIKE